MNRINGVTTSPGSVARHADHATAATGTSATRSFATALQAAAGMNTIPAPVPPTAATSPKVSGHELQEKALKIHEYRLQLIAANIANADTPNYKAVDIDFREALRSAQTGPAQGHAHMPEVRIAYTIPSQPSVDGNTVDMEQERAKFADSMLRYQFSVNKVGGHYKMMAELLASLKD